MLLGLILNVNNFDGFGEKFGKFWLVVAGCCWLWVVVAGCGWFWLVVGGFGWLWVVLARSSF